MKKFKTSIAGFLSLILLSSSCGAKGNLKSHEKKVKANIGRQKRSGADKSVNRKKNLVNSPKKCYYCDDKTEDKVFFENQNGAKDTGTTNKNDKKALNDVSKYFKQIWTWIPENPGKTVATGTVISYLLALFVGKVGDALIDDDKLFKLLNDWITNSETYERFNANSLSEYEKKNLKDCLQKDEKLKFLYCLCKEFRRNLKDDEGKPKSNYSLARTAVRRVGDMLIIRGAVTRQERSCMRYLCTQKGTCWEASQIFDFCCRMFGFGEHHMVVSIFRPGIYHAFNYFVYENERYFCDPLNGLFAKVTVNDNSIGNFIINYLVEAQKVHVNAGLPYFQGYILKQINSDTKRSLGMVPMARLLSPKCELNDNMFYESNGNKTNDNGDFLQLTGGGVVFNGSNANFNKYSTFLFG